MGSDSDDELTLSSSTIGALKDFYKERDEREKRFADLQAVAEAASKAKAAADAEAALPDLTMASFTEDWNESQFWYSDETATVLARQLLDGTDASSLIVVVSTPSVFIMLKNIAKTISAESRPRMLLLEHDKRFAVFGDEFIFYDFNEPTNLPAALRGTADRLICDPPFLSEDCQTKTALTLRWIGKPGPKTRIISCTGERMAELITTKLYKAQGVRITTFLPQHSNGLSNEFLSYANFECADWKFRDA
ncbi:n-6 adenine-specific DNA methyltransferase 2 [Sporothrix brasiliensis 5110]|uniref:Protein-lysine N-methyltransferase EFM5 n=1 Tax=Sporothrix brasiliensis 5110 TaxID=1398154 RepID=A0A0C2ERH7_9PEZI|nr:n-6 adenine-specific DNA methyltransferase 2 [Sporothrix brasiliensis 5110]KIH88984.1 n-6 adenine-specific DNA methyltransferase 2 [Sporothrix brasiliensis 5110]